MKVMICGGGTGGHVYPAIALAKKLKEKTPGVDIVFVGTSRGIESRIVPDNGFKIELLPSKPFSRKLSLDIFPFAWSVVKGFFISVSLIKRFSPNVVVGVGGYASFSPILAAALLRKPTVLHEQNVIPGLSNRILSKVSSKIALSHKDSLSYFKSRKKLIITGNPVRPEVLEKRDRKIAAKTLGIDPYVKTVLVFGGSQGAKSINKAIVEAYGLLRNKNLQILHITGEKEFKTINDEITLKHTSGDSLFHKVYDYYANMSDLYSVSDLVICRAGATTIAELTVNDLPAILVPYPFASDDHQQINARALYKRGAVEIINDLDLDANRISKILDEVLFNDAKLADMKKAASEYGKPEASEKLADLVLETAK